MTINQANHYLDWIGEPGSSSRLEAIARLPHYFGKHRSDAAKRALIKRKIRTTMTEAQKLINQLNQENIHQKKSEWEECISEKQWEAMKEMGYKELKHGIAVDTRRWYETSVTAFELGGEIFGVRSLTNMFNESGDYESCFVHLLFFEMEETTEITYRVKA